MLMCLPKSTQCIEVAILDECISLAKLYTAALLASTDESSEQNDSAHLS